MVYGPGDPLHRFAQWVAPMKAQRPKISIAAGLAQWRSPRGYVINVAHAAALAAQSPTSATRVFNVAEREAFSELEWAKLIAAEMGWRGSFEIAEQRMSAAAPNYEQHWIVSSERIRTELGYSEVVPREEAVRVTAEWELENVA
jgi:nucleoside-diphosphate-sugar epimerase